MIARNGNWYSYDQINIEVTDFICSQYSIPAHCFQIATCGVQTRFEEEEEECCVMLQPDETLTQSILDHLEDTFLSKCEDFSFESVKPDRFRIDHIPLIQSKGVPYIPALYMIWKSVIEEDKNSKK